MLRLISTYIQNIEKLNRISAFLIGWNIPRQSFLRVLKNVVHIQKKMVSNLNSLNFIHMYMLENIEN